MKRLISFFRTGSDNDNTDDQVPMTRSVRHAKAQPSSSHAAARSAGTVENTGRRSVDGDDEWEEF